MEKFGPWKIFYDIKELLSQYRYFLGPYVYIIISIYLAYVYWDICELSDVMCGISFRMSQGGWQMWFIGVVGSLWMVPGLLVLVSAFQGYSTGWKWSAQAQSFRWTGDQPAGSQGTLALLSHKCTPVLPEHCPFPLLHNSLSFPDSSTLKPVYHLTVDLWKYTHLSSTVNNISLWWSLALKTCWDLLLWDSNFSVF